MEVLYVFYICQESCPNASISEVVIPSSGLFVCKVKKTHRCHLLSKVPRHTPQTISYALAPSCIPSPYPS